MAVVSQVYTPSLIVQGPSDVYVGVQNPPSATPPVQGTNTWGPVSGGGLYTLDANGQPADNGTTGFHIGLSDGPVMLNMAPKFLEIRADQHAATVDAAFTSLETEIDFIVKEALLKNLSQFFSSTTGTYTNVAAGGGNPAADFLQVGSITTDAVFFKSLLLVSPDRTRVGGYYVVNGYKTYLKSAIQTTFKRTTESTWKLKMVCVADVTRVFGDMVAQIVRM